jgi:hypothetical protein
VFDFYYVEYKPLYSDVVTANRGAQEAWQEIAAAFDHIARHYGEDGRNEAECADEAKSHLKRACLDMYKLEFADTKRVYDALCELPINLIDNGDFEKGLHALFAETRKLAAEARILEGVKRVDSPLSAFGVWAQVYENCKRIASKEFQLNPNVDWAKRKRDRKTTVGLVVGVLGFVWGVLTTLGVIPTLVDARPAVAAPANQAPGPGSPSISPLSVF